jgi:hypothetical protein
MKSSKTFFPDLKQLDNHEVKEKSQGPSYKLKNSPNPLPTSCKKRLKTKKTGSLADPSLSKASPSHCENFQSQFMMLTKYSKSSPKVWNEEQTITKYLDLIQESDEKVKLSYEVLTQKAALERNSIKEKKTKKKEKVFQENKVLFETPENKDFFKSFSEKQLNHFENFSKKGEIFAREDFVEPVRTVKKVQKEKGIEKNKAKGLRNFSEKVKNGRFEVKENGFHRKSSNVKNEIRAGPLILTKAESYLKKQSEKSSNVSPKISQSSRFMSLDRKGNELGVSSPKNLVSMSEVYKNSEGIKQQKASMVVQSPKEFSITYDINSFPSSPAYSRVVSFRNYLNNKL